MKQLRIIISSTRPGRAGASIGQFVAKQAAAETWNVEFLDLAEEQLPFLDEEDVPRNGNYQLAHTKQWAAKVEAADAIVIVTPEYNAAYPATLKNAIDMLFAEWNNKPIGVVGYGFGGGVRATQALTPVLANVQADERGVVNITLGKDAELDGTVSSEAAGDAIRELIASLA